MSITTEESAGTTVMLRSAKSLPSYLNDHLAGETLGLELATRASVEHNGTPLGTFLLLLSWELEEDRDSLVELMDELGVGRKRAGVVSARIAQKVRRLKVTGSSPLSILAELESLDLRINDKLDMWSALRSSVGDRVDGIDFDGLIRRAEGQAEALERRRLAVAAEGPDAYGRVTATPPSGVQSERWETTLTSVPLGSRSMKRRTPQSSSRSA
jgi:hypothetical protein